MRKQQYILDSIFLYFTNFILFLDELSASRTDIEN